MLSNMFVIISTLSATSAAASPWDGTWTLDAARSSPGVAGQAAEGYRFRIGADQSISWEIQSLGEVVLGKTDDAPMVVRRAGKDSGTRLSVVADGPAILRYRVSKAGHVIGGGRMTLVDGGKAWVDVTWAPQGPPYAAELIYVRKQAGG
jgi:hypothetical protein